MRASSRWVRQGLRATFVVAGVLALATAAFAGKKFFTEVTVNDVSGYGSIGAARASADDNQRLGCLSFGTDGFCYAVDRDGNAKSCAWTGPKHAAAVNSIGPNSFLSFKYDDKGNCGTLFVSNTSVYAPVVP